MFSNKLSPGWLLIQVYLAGLSLSPWSPAHCCEVSTSGLCIAWHMIQHHSWNMHPVTPNESKQPLTRLCQTGTGELTSWLFTYLCSETEEITWVSLHHISTSASVLHQCRWHHYMLFKCLFCTRHPECGKRESFANSERWEISLVGSSCISTHVGLHIGSTFC